MAVFIVPSDPDFNVTAVTQIKESDYILADFVNDYYQIFLNNDKYLYNHLTQQEAQSNDTKEKLIEQMNQLESSTDQKMTDLKTSVEKEMSDLDTKLTGRMDTLETTLNQKIENYYNELKQDLANIHIDEMTDDDLRTANSYFN